MVNNIKFNISTIQIIYKYIVLRPLFAMRSLLMRPIILFHNVRDIIKNTEMFHKNIEN